MAMMGSSVAGGNELSALLAVVADPKAFAEKLAELEKVQKAIDEEKSALDKQRKDTDAYVKKAMAKLEADQKAAVERIKFEEQSVVAAMQKVKRDADSLDVVRKELQARADAVGQQELALSHAGKELADREEKIAAKEAALNNRERDMSVRLEEHGKSMQGREAAVAAREADVSSREAKLVAGEKAYEAKVRKLTEIIGGPSKES